MIVIGEKNINCFLCKHYKPSDFIDFQGHCVRKAACVDSENTSTGGAGGAFARLWQPALSWCGDFEQWTGTPRAQGTCPYNGPTAAAAEVTEETKAAADAQAVKAAATTKAATTKATKGGKS